MTFTAHNVEILSKHIEIIHHIKGRVRFKINSKIQNYAKEIDLETIGGLDKAVKGIKSVSLNKIARSLTIEYDDAIIKGSLWEELATSVSYEKTACILNGLVKRG